MTGAISTIPKHQFFDNAGIPAVGYKLYTYLAGSLTPANTWQDQALSSLNTNPIILDARGECSLWLDPAKEYKLVLKTDTDASVWTVDDVSGADSGLRSDLASSSAGKGAELVGFLQDGAGSVSRTVQSKLQDSVSILDFGGVSGQDSTAAFDLAKATGKAIFFPAGEWFLNYARATSGTYIYGEGPNTKIKPLTADVRCAIGCDSGAALSFIENVTIRDLEFCGFEAVPTFSEQKHLVSMNGVKNLNIQRVGFVGFRGDGLYLGSGDSAGQERHNKNVKISHSYFDGINKENRDGISIIDCDGFVSSKNTYRNCTKTGMPGAVNIEPDANAYHVIRNITSVDDTWENCGGDGGFKLNTAAATLTTPVSNIQVIRPTFTETNTHSVSLNLATDEAMATVQDMGIIAEGGTYLAPTLAFGFNRIRGITFRENTIRGAAQAGVLGIETVAATTLKDAKFLENTVLDSSSTTGLITIGTVENLEIRGNTLKNKDVAGHVNGLVFYGNGVTTTSTNVDITDNRIIKGSAQTSAIKAVGHTFLTQTKNHCAGNNLDAGLTNTFLHQGDMDFLPVLTASTPGDLSVAYSARAGKISKVGRLVTAQFSLTTSTWSWTTASGVIRIAGFPFASSAGLPAVGSIYGEGWTLAGVSSLSVVIDAGNAFARIGASRSGAVATSIIPSQCPSGTQQTYYGTVQYFTDDI